MTYARQPSWMYDIAWGIVLIVQTVAQVGCTGCAERARFPLTRVIDKFPHPGTHQHSVEWLVGSQAKISSPLLTVARMAVMGVQQASVNGYEAGNSRARQCVRVGQHQRNRT